MDKQSEPRSHFLLVIKSLAIEKRDVLEQWKSNYKLWERPDFVWHSLLGAFSTWRSSRGWAGLMDNPNNYSKVTFEALAKLDPDARINVIEATFRDAKLMDASKKAKYLVRNYDIIIEMGGPSGAKKLLESAVGVKAKINFWKQFVGVGDKYSRDIMMDIYHPEFRDVIAIDVRIKNISKLLGVSFDSYEEHEKYYLGIAQEAGLNGWELDRLLYNFNDEIIIRLKTGDFSNVKNSAETQLETRVKNLESKISSMEEKLDHLTVLLEQIVARE